MRVLVLGVGDAFAFAGFPSGLLVDAPGGWLMIDCPDMVHRALREAVSLVEWPVTARNVHDVLITHLHGDHANGLEAFGFKRYAERLADPTIPVPRLHTHPRAAERVWEKLAPAMDAPLTPGGQPATLADFFDLGSFTPGEPAQIAGLTIESRWTHHPIPTTALRITDGRSTLALSSDTTFDPELIEWLSEAEVIIHESNSSPIHTPVEKLNDLPRQLRRRMRLTHLEPGFDVGRTDIPILREGDVIEV
jgi:ribonuclease BN (tRNA processing enzyme)